MTDEILLLIQLLIFVGLFYFFAFKGRNEGKNGNIAAKQKGNKMDISALNKASLPQKNSRKEKSQKRLGRI